MTRIALTNGSGQYFDKDKAVKFDEATWWDGSSFVSCATGSDKEHEQLYRTKGGKWILHHKSQWDGIPVSYKEISNSEAAAWLVRNDHDPHAACAEEFAALEIT